MSLELSMRSWCDDYKVKSNDRAENIVKIKKNSLHVVQRHVDRRVKSSVKTRELLRIGNINNKKKVVLILKNYVKDRSEAIGILAAMRSKT